MIRVMQFNVVSNNVVSNKVIFLNAGYFYICIFCNMLANQLQIIFVIIIAAFLF